MADLIAILIAMAWMVAIAVLLFLAAERESKSLAAGAFIVTAVGIWVGVNLFEPESRPCVRYETTMIYNASLKMMMPAKYCAQYGEWVTGNE